MYFIVFLLSWSVVASKTNGGTTKGHLARMLAGVAHFVDGRPPSAGRRLVPQFVADRSRGPSAPRLVLWRESATRYSELVLKRSLVPLDTRWSGARRRPRSHPYASPAASTGAPCVLARRHPAHSGDEASLRNELSGATQLLRADKQLQRVRHWFVEGPSVAVPAHRVRDLDRSAP